MSRQSRGIPISINGVLVTATAAELNALTGVTASAAELNTLDGYTGTTTELNLIDGYTGTTAELNQLDGSILVDFPEGAGYSGADNIQSSVVKVGGLFRTDILVEIDGLNEGDTDADVIGTDGDAVASHLGQITVAVNGTILAGTMTCHEVPTGGATNIDLYSNDSSLAQDVAVTGGVNSTALITKGGAWSAGDVVNLTAWPAVNQYLYLAVGEAATDVEYTAGIFHIVLWGV